MDGFSSKAGIVGRLGYTSRAALLLQLLDDFRWSRTSSARCSARPGRTASTWPQDLGWDHDERGVGLRRLRLPDHPRPAGRRRRDVEGLQHRVGQRAFGNTTTSSSSGSGTPTTAHAGEQGRVPERRPEGRCRRCRSSSRASRAVDEHPPADVTVGMGIQEELITALRSSAGSPRRPPTTSTAATSSTCRRPSSMRSASDPIPTWVISPFAKPSPELTFYDTYPEVPEFPRHGLIPTLTSVNHLRRVDALRSGLRGAAEVARPL